MRRDENVRVIPKRVCRGNRFYGSHVQRRVGDDFLVDGLQQVRFDEVQAAPDVDETRAPTAMAE